MSYKIENIKGRQILDSRGYPTVEAEVILENGYKGRASVPSGASTGTHEALELRDGDPSLFLGKSVTKAINIIDTTIAKALVGMNVMDQAKIDTYMCHLDNTKNKSYMGGNTILAVSLAIARAASNTMNIPLWHYIGGINAHILPTPMMNILNGGKHANNNIDFQEFMIIPGGFNTFSEALHAGYIVFHNLKKILNAKGLSTSVGDEGGFAPELSSNEEAIELILKAIEQSGYKPDIDISIALDAAASELYNTNTKCYKVSNKNITTEEMVELWDNWTKKYPILSIEDGLEEDDWHGWDLLTKKLGNKIQLVGDDLFVTNVERIQKGIDHQIANAVLIKVNQIGSLTETLNSIQLSHHHNYRTIISHRSGETEDTFIADIAVATNSGQIKTGSLSRTDRTAKYNQLLRIEEHLGEQSEFHGFKSLSQYVKHDM